MESRDPLKGYITQEGLPHNLESETAIDSILMNNNAVMEVLTEHGINEDHFHNTFMRDVYSTCKKFIDDGKNLDPLIIINDLRKKYKDEEVIKRNVEQLYEANILTEAVSTHIDNLIEYKQRREQVIKAVKLFDEGYNDKFVVERQEDVLSCLESWNQIQSMDIKIEWIIERHIPKGSITLVFGKGGIGKTWLLLDMARCIGSGIPWLGFNTIKTPVVFIDFENPLAVLNTRTQILGDAEGVYFWRAHNNKLKAPKLDSKDWEQYKRLPKGSVLIFDTLRASHGRDENASNEMQLIMNKLKELRDAGFTIILIHHTPKNSDSVAKGSTAIVDLADHNLGLTKVKKKKEGKEIVVDDDDNDEDTIFRFGFCEKTRYEPHHIYLTLNPDKGFELAPDPQEETLKAMHGILKEQGTIKKTAFIETCHSLGISKNKLRRLVDIGQGRYWTIERHKEQRNAMLVTAKNQFSSFPTIYKGEKLNNCQESLENISI